MARLYIRDTSVKARNEENPNRDWNNDKPYKVGPTKAQYRERQSLKQYYVEKKRWRKRNGKSKDGPIERTREEVARDVALAIGSNTSTTDSVIYAKAASERLHRSQRTNVTERAFARMGEAALANMEA